MDSDTLVQELNELTKIINSIKCKESRLVLGTKYIKLSNWHVQEFKSIITDFEYEKLTNTLLEILVEKETDYKKQLKRLL